MLSHLSRVRLIVTPWTAACQAPLSMGLSRQEYWCVLPCPPAGDLPNPGIEPTSLMFPTLAGRFLTTTPPKTQTFWPSQYFSNTLVNAFKSKVQNAVFLEYLEREKLTGCPVFQWIYSSVTDHCYTCNFAADLV